MLKLSVKFTTFLQLSFHIVLQLSRFRFCLRGWQICERLADKGKEDDGGDRKTGPTEGPEEDFSGEAHEGTQR